MKVIGTQPGEEQRLVTKRSYPNDWEKSYHLSSVTASSSSPMAASTVTTLVQDSKRNYIAGGPVYMDPVKSLSDINKNQSGTWIEVPREKKVLKRAQRFQTSRKKKRALILPQRRPNQGAALNNVFMDNQQDENQENRVPQSVVRAYQKPTKAVSENHLPLQQQIRTRSMNTSERGQHLEPWSWSESSNSSQVTVEYQTAEWEAVKPVQNANTIQKQRVTWQLLDFISDSD